MAQDWDSALSASSVLDAPPRTGGKSQDWDAALSSVTKDEPTLRPLRFPGMSEAGPLPKQDPRYDPRRFTSEYLWNEAKKVPGGLVGLAPDVLDWLIKKYAAEPTDFGNITRKLQTATGADVSMKPPGPGSEKLGILTQNVIGGLPFAAGAVPVRGLLGAGTEMLSSLGGGVGQVMGREVAGAGSPVSELAGNVAGSMIGFRAGNIAEKVVPIGGIALKAMASREARAATVLKAQGIIQGTPEYAAAMQQQMATAKGEILGDLAKSYAQEDMKAVSNVLDQYETIKQKFPGFKASIGEITGNEPALGMQAKLESRNIPALEERGARIRANEAAIRDARGNLVPVVPGAGRAALRGAQASIDDELRALGQREAGLAEDVAGATTRMEGAAVPVATAGATIKGAAQEGYLASRGAANAKYQAFRDAVGPDTPTNAGGVISKLNELEQRFVFDKQPEVLGLIKGVTDANRNAQVAKMTVAELDDLSAVANRDIQREMSKSNPDRRAIAQLQAIRTSAKETIESTLEARGNTDALSKYKEANRYFGEEHAPKYLTGVNLQLRMKDALNEQRIKPEDVVKAYFNPNAVTEARRFNTQFADNGPAKETLARGVFDLYKKEVIDAGGGVINSNRHEFFMRKYGSTLAEYPWIAKRLEKNAVAGEIATRMAEVRAQRGEIAASDVAKAVGERNPDAFIEKAISDKRFMFNSLVKMQPEDRKNMAVAVLNKAWDESGKGSASVNRFLENEDNLKMLFRIGYGAKEGAEHLNNIKLLARALEINEAAPKTAPMTALAEDTLKAKTGTSFLQVMSALRAMGRRPGSGDWFAMVFGGQYMKAKIDAQKTEILKEQLFDPALLKATLENYRATSGGLGVAGNLVGERAKQIRSKMFDLLGAVFGRDAPTAAAKRLPIGAVAAEEPQP